MKSLVKKSAAAPQVAAKVSYVNLRSTGRATIREIRNVPNSDDLAVRMSVYFGKRTEGQDPKYTFVDYDLYVKKSASEALDAIAQACEKNPDAKVKVSFVSGDTYPHLAVDKEGNPMKRKDGSFVNVIKGSLVAITWAAVGDDVIIAAEKSDEDSEVASLEEAAA